SAAKSAALVTIAPTRPRDGRRMGSSRPRKMVSSTTGEYTSTTKAMRAKPPGSARYFSMSSAPEDSLCGTSRSAQLTLSALVAMAASASQEKCRCVGVSRKDRHSARRAAGSRRHRYSQAKAAKEMSTHGAASAGGICNASGTPRRTVERTAVRTHARHRNNDSIDRLTTLFGRARQLQTNVTILVD